MISIFVMWGVHYISMEIESPFGFKQNDLPIDQIMVDMNESLITLLHPMTQKPPAYNFSANEIALKTRPEYGTLTKADSAARVSTAQLETLCVCGNTFMADSKFCRKCGAQRASRSSKVEASAIGSTEQEAPADQEAPNCPPATLEETTHHFHAPVWIGELSPLEKYSQPAELQGDPPKHPQLEPQTCKLARFAPPEVMPNIVIQKAFEEEEQTYPVTTPPASRQGLLPKPKQGTVDALGQDLLPKADRGHFDELGVMSLSHARSCRTSPM